jgi:hypothetical protein
MLGAHFRNRPIQVVGRSTHYCVAIDDERFELSRLRYVELPELGFSQIGNVFERAAISQSDPLAETTRFQ